MRYRSQPLIGLLLLIVVGCGVSGDRRGGDRDAPLAEVLTLELTFGAEGIAEEYILARPYPEGVGIDPEGNILVVDEVRVKVFDPDGTPKRLLGGSGEGPGEFSRPERIWMSPDGYFTVSDERTMNYFRPDHAWFERINLGNLPSLQEIMAADHLLPMGPEVVYCLGETARVYAIDSRDADLQNRTRKEIYLFYQDADSLTLLARYPQSNFVASPTSGQSIWTGSWGMLLLAPLPDRRIVYLHSYHDTEITDEEVSYRLTILDLDSMQRTYLDHQDRTCIPVEITWEPLTYPEEYRTRDPELWRSTQEMNRLVEEFIAERRYSAPVNRLLTDDEHIFVFTDTTNDSSGVKVDVFDPEGGYLRSAWFPVGFGRIRDGYLYKVNNYFAGDIFPQIEKYRIDPRVYGRR